MENVYQEDEIDIKDGPKIAWIKVQDAAKLLWSENPKLHSIGDLVQSIEKYGFQELPRYDIQLPNISGGQGAVKAGNGRIETLAAMERDAMQLPRGLAADKTTGAWVMPVLVGTDADSLNAARAYAIDSNNLTMSGGDFTAFDFQRLWNSQQYISMLKVLAENTDLPISVSGEDLDMFLTGLQVGDLEVSGEDKEMGVVTSFQIQVANGMLLEEAVRETRLFLESHEEWKAKIVLGG